MQSSISLNRRKAIGVAGGIAGAAAGLGAFHSCTSAPPVQDQQRKQPAPAKPEDVATIDGIIAAVYAAISGPSGARDWDRLRSLFHTSARLIPCFLSPEAKENGIVATRVFNIEEFIKAIEPRVKTEGFYEHEIARRVNRFGSIAQVFSTYESRHAPEDAKPFTRGINSIQLFFDGKRWWTVTILWDSERRGQEIPGEFLPKQGG